MASTTARAATSWPSASPITCSSPATRSDVASLGEHEVCAEQPRLLAGAVGELVAADPPGEARDVAEPRARARLAAGDLALEHDRVEPLGGRVDRGREPGRAGADDRDVVGLRRPAACRRRRPRRGRRRTGRPARGRRGERRSGSREPSPPGLVQQRGARVGVGRVAGERRVEARQQVADLVAATAVLGRRDPEHREPVGLEPGPAREELADARYSPWSGSHGLTRW